MKKNTIFNNNILGKSLLTVVVGAGMTFSAASAATIVIDDVDTTAVNPFVSATLGSGVTVTGANMLIANPGNTTIDTTLAPWNGNEYTYIMSDINTDAAGGGLGNVTYEAASGDYFSDFGAQIIVNRSAYSDPNATEALAGFTFEGSTDGVSFSTISVSGTFVDMVPVGGATYADFYRFEVTPTSALGQMTDLRVGMLAPNGATWHQQIGSVDMEVTAVPEPSAFALLAGMFGLTWVMLKRPSARS